MEIPDPLDRVVFRGKSMDRKTAAFLAIMEKRLGYELTITQGPYNPGGVGASGGTHDRGGVVDLTSYDAARKVKVARDLGAFAWERLPSEGPWPHHVHLGIRGHQDLAPAAANQETAYNNKRNGLANNAVDWNKYHPDVELFNYRAAYRDDLLRQRIKGLQAQRKKLADRIASAKDRITYRVKK